jgi:hypothetical protein
MSAVRLLTRDWRFCVLLAYAFVLAGLAGARLVGHHTSEMHALAALQIICSEHGLTLPSDPEKDHGKDHSGCPCGPSCPFKTFGSVASASIGPAWSDQEADNPVHVARHTALPPSHAPPGVSARGPPNLI